MSGGRFNNLEFGGHETPEQPGEWTNDHAPEQSAFQQELRDGSYHLQLARKLELAGDTEEAMRAYSAALGEDPRQLSGWIGQLWLLGELEEFPELDLWARKALETFPDNPQLMAMRSIGLHRMGHRQEARDLNDMALERSGESDTVWLARAEVMMSEQRLAAEECLNHARRATEEEAIMLLRAGAICLRHDRLQMGVRHLESLVASHESARGWFLLGELRKRLGLVEPARVAFEQAATLAPTNMNYKQAGRSADPGFLGRISGIFRRFKG
jgi:tetratricopeptide (TPR) repeat protein